VFFFFSSARETVGRFETFTIVSPSFVVFLTFLMQQLLTHVGVFGSVRKPG